MKKVLLMFMAGLLLVSLNVFAHDGLLIDSSGNAVTGVAEDGMLSVYGQNHIAIYANNAGNSSAVYGDNYTGGTSTGQLGGSTYGVSGFSDANSGMGVNGSSYGSGGYGVYGYAGGYSSVRAVYGEHFLGNYGYIGGSVDAISGISNHPTGSGIYAQNTNTGFAGYFAGKVHVAGTFTASNKQFIQPHAKDPSKEIVYIAAEASEAVIFQRGTGQLINGSAEIDLPEYFSVVAADEGLQVQVTPTEECNGMFVESKGKNKIRIKELMSGKHNARFDYLVTGVRAGFEEHDPIAENSHFKPRENETAEDFENRFNGQDLSTRAIRNMLIANGILSEDGKLNMATVKKLGWTVVMNENEADGYRIAGIDKEH